MPRSQAMTDDRVFEKIHYRDETKLFSNYAWRWILENRLKKWVLALNMSFLVDDDISDAMGQPIANEIRNLIGCVLQRHGNAVDAAQPYEDQFTAHSDDHVLLESIATGLSEAVAKVGIFVRHTDGGGVVQTGLDFKYAIGASYKEADVASGRGGTRGVLRILPVESFDAALEAAEQSGFLMLDGARLLEDRKRTTYLDPKAAELLVENVEEPWPTHARQQLDLAEERDTYLPTALGLISHAAGNAMARRRAELRLVYTNTPNAGSLCFVSDDALFKILGELQKQMLDWRPVAPLEEWRRILGTDVTPLKTFVATVLAFDCVVLGYTALVGVASQIDPRFFGSRVQKKLEARAEDLLASALMASAVHAASGLLGPNARILAEDWVPNAEALVKSDHATYAAEAAGMGLSKIRTASLAFGQSTSDSHCRRRLLCDATFILRLTEECDTARIALDLLFDKTLLHANGALMRLTRKT